MSTTANAIPESPGSAGLGAAGIAPAAMKESRLFYWSVRRELWEYRSIYVAPLAVTGVFLFGFLISLTRLPHKMRELAFDPAKLHKVITTPYDFAAGLIMATTLIVAVIYSLEALHGERRDRSILFWKSLPVSDRTTVLAKASVPIVILPLLTAALTAVTQFVMLLLQSAVVSANGGSVAGLWTEVAWAQMTLMITYHLITVHSLSHAPFYAWLMLVSAWARRAAFLWAVLPIFAVSVLEKVVFGTSYFSGMLGSQAAGGSEAMVMSDPTRFPYDPGMHLTPGRFLLSPGLWLGLAVTATFLVAAMKVRRERGPL